MKKLFIVLGMLLVVTSMVFAQTNTVAVVPFDYKGVSSDDAETLTELFTSEYAAATNITVVDRVSFDKIKEQMKFELTDWSNNEKIVQIGKALNANLVLCGQVRTLGNKVTLNVRVVNVNTTAIVSSSTGSTTDIVGFLDEIPIMVEKMTMKQIYKIGDIGPGGGYIFYVSEVTFPVHQPDGSSKMCKYLEVSPLELGQYTWCSCTDNRCSVSTSDGLGAGVVNTANILKAKHRSGISISNCAAYACSKYYTGTTKQGDWYLPSKMELDLLYRNLRDKIINTGSSDFHWSSSQYKSDFYAWGQGFSTGGQYDGYKGYTGSVRAIRAFNY